MDTKYDIHDIYEMVFLTKRKVELMSIEELIVIDYFFKNKLLNLTQEEKTKIIELRENLTRLLIAWEN